MKIAVIVVGVVHWTQWRHFLCDNKWTIEQWWTLWFKSCIVITFIRTASANLLIFNIVILVVGDVASWLTVVATTRVVWFHLCRTRLQEHTVVVVRNGGDVGHNGKLDHGACGHFQFNRPISATET